MLDFGIGVPVIAILAALRRRKCLPNDPVRIGFLAPTAIGDLILDSGLIAHVAARYPRAELHIFHGASNASVIPLLPVAVTSHQCDFTAVWKTIRSIRQKRVDILIDLTPWPRLTALYAMLSGARTVGFQSEHQYRHFGFDVPVRHERRHEVENLTAMASVFGHCSKYAVRIRPVATPPGLPIDWEKLVLCHVAPGGSRAEWKRWPSRNWTELVKALLAEEVLIGFSGTKGDARLVDEILAGGSFPSDRVISLCGKLTLSELASVIKACRLCITVDTGVLHLASALDAPTIALLGPTRSARWGALSPRAINLDSPHPGGGFIHLGFESSECGAEVMPALSVDCVAAAAKQCLSGMPVLA